MNASAKTIIAVGSTRKPKLNAVHDALAAISPLFGGEVSFEVIGVEVDSGVSHTPVSSKESMQGARQRAEALQALAKKERNEWNYFVGLEGGLEILVEERAQRRVFLESWAYVSDGARGHFGRSGGIELPAALAHEVLERQVELAAAIDRFAGAVGIRDGQGAWGVLSGNLISRQEAFRVALIVAFAPFFNAKLFQTSLAAS